MKKLFYALLIISIGGFTAFGQTTTTIKETTKIAEQPTIEREKFDPTRNAAEDLKAAIATAQKDGKRIILDVGGEWCGWCRLMDNYLIKNAELGKLRDENYVWLKINMSEENENKEFLAVYPKATGYPHLYVLEKDGTLLKSKNTSELEEEKGYNLQKFTDFLKEYAPSKTTMTK